MAKYRFVGDGLGVPGLPHVIDNADALEHAQRELLAECVRNRLYEQIKEQAAPARQERREKKEREE